MQIVEYPHDAVSEEGFIQCRRKKPSQPLGRRWPEVDEQLSYPDAASHIHLVWRARPTKDIKVIVRYGVG
jgi:hypothetical protein